MEEKSLVDLIDTAIGKEEEAYRFYMDLHDQVEDSGVKDTLSWIADEERKHKEFLIRYRNDEFPLGSLPKRDVTYYRIAEHQEVPDTQGDMKSHDAFLVAAHRELRSHHFYSHLADLHAEGEAKELLRKMATEELKHKEKMEYLYANTAFPQTDGG